MSLPKYKQDAINRVKQRLSADHLINQTSIFKDFPGNKNLDKETTDQIYRSLMVYLDSWVLPDLEEIEK